MVIVGNLSVKPIVIKFVIRNEILRCTPQSKQWSYLGKDCVFKLLVCDTDVSLLS